MTHAKVKICGVTRIEDAEMCIAAGVDAIGINFAPESPRYIGNPKIAERLIKEANVTGRVLCAGVFVNAALNEILDAVSALKLDIVQLHGEETPDFLMQFRERFKDQAPAGSRRPSLWKAFPINSPNDLSFLAAYDCDAWLLDTKSTGARGGSGKTFDWSIIHGWKRDRPIVLAGGIRVENAAQAVQLVQPEWIDVASGVESAPGVKQGRAVIELLQNVRRVNLIVSFPSS